MKARTMLVAVPVVLLAYSANLLWSESPDGPGKATAVRTVSSEARVSDETTGPSTADDSGMARFPIQRATTPAEVREVVRITKDATSADQKALVDVALESEDGLVVGNALKALGRLGAMHSNPDVIGLMRDPRLRVRQDAVIACGLDGAVEAIPHLERALAQRETAVRPLIVDALGRIGGPRAHALIEEVVADPQATNTDRVFARAALERIASSAPRRALQD